MNEDRTQDEQIIRDMVQRAVDSWNAGDAAAFAAPFAEDADFVVVNGMHIQGREAITAGHRWLFDTIYRGSHNAYTVENLRFVRSDVALARVGARLQVGEETREARSLWVFTKEGGSWQVASFQNTLIEPPGPPPG